MTAKTDEGSLELRRPGPVRLLVERVEHHARTFVVSGHLEDVAAADPAEGHAIVEEHRARILFANLLPADSREKTSSCESTGSCSASSAERR